MKPRGSKRQIAVMFKPFMMEVKADQNNEYPPIVFGTQGLQMITVDDFGATSRKRRTLSSSRYGMCSTYSTRGRERGSEGVGEWGRHL